MPIGIARLDENLKTSDKINTKTIVAQPSSMATITCRDTYVDTTSAILVTMRFVVAVAFLFSLVPIAAHNDSIIPGPSSRNKSVKTSTKAVFINTSAIPLTLENRLFPNTPNKSFETLVSAPSIWPCKSAMPIFLPSSLTPSQPPKLCSKVSGKCCTNFADSFTTTGPTIATIAPNTKTTIK